MSTHMETAQTESALSRLLRAGLALFFVALVLALYPYTTYPSAPIKQLVVHWGAFLLGTAWLIGTFLKKERVQKPPVVFELLVIFLAFNLVASLFSTHVSNSLGHVRWLLSCFLLYLMASHVFRTTAQLRRFLLVVCLAVACSSVYAFCQRQGLDPFPWADRTAVEYKELPGTFGNPNYAAHTLILCIVISLYLAWRKRTFWCVGFTALFAAHMYFAHQRGGLVALAAALVLCVIALFARRLIKGPAKTAAAILTVFLLLGVVGAGSIMGLAKARTGSAFPIDESLMLRYHSFYSAARMAKDRPLLGFGPRNYQIENAAYWTDYEQRWFAEQRLMNSHVHNDVLETAIDAGLPAAGLYVGLLLAGMVFGLALGRSDDSESRRVGFMFAAFFCVYLVDGLFGFNSRVPVSGVLLFIMLGALEGVWRSKYGTTERRPAPRMLAFAWRGAAILCLIAIVVVETRTFAGELKRYRGKGYIMGKGYAGAAHTFAAGASLMPWDWRLVLDEGRAWMRQQKREQAIERFDRALSLNPNYLPTLIAIAHAHFEQGLKLLNQTNSPDHALADVAAQTAEYLDEAERHAQRAIDLCPMLPEAHDLLGRAASIRAGLLPKLGGVDNVHETIETSWRRGEEHLDKAVTYGARNPARVNTMLAEARVASGDLEGAEEAYMTALRSEPSVKETWQRYYQFAKTHDRIDTVGGKLEESIHEMSAQLNQEKDAIASMYMWRALLEGELYKNPERAVTAFRKALRHAPAREDIWSAFALFAADAGKRPALRNTALEALQNFENRSQSPIPALATVGAVYDGGTKGLFKASRVLLDAVGKAEGDEHKAAVSIGWAAEILLEEVEKAGTSFPQWAPTVLNLGQVLMGIRAYDVAQHVLAAAMPRLSPEQIGECAQLLAEVLVQQERFDEAIQVLQFALAHSTKQELLRLDLARTLAKANRESEARKVYQEILDSKRLTGEGRRIVQQEYEALSQ